MNNKLRYSVCYYSLCGLIFFLAYLLQSIPGFLELGDGYKPLLLVGCVVSVAIFEKEYAGALFGVFAGALCDLNANTYFGFNAMMFMACGLAVGLLCEYLTQRNLRNCVCFAAVFLVLLCSVNFFFQMGIYKYEGAVVYWLKSTVGTTLFSLVFVPAFYWLFGKVHRRFEKYREG